MKLRNLFLAFLLLLSFISTQAQKSQAENIFKKYLDTEEKTVAKIIVNLNDSLYSVYCQGVLAEKQVDKRRFFTKFITLEPKLGVARAFLSRGISFVASNKLDSALSDFNISIRFDSTYLNSYYQRGQLYATMEKHDKALKDFNQVIKMSPNLPSGYHLRGLSYLSLKDYPNALADFNKVIELDPKADQAYLVRGVVYREQEDYLIAIENWKQAKKINKEDTQIADQLIAQVKAKMKDAK